MKPIIFLGIIAIISCAKWYPSVTGYSESDYNNGFAGDLQKPVVGVKISGNVKFKIHYKGKGWQSEVTGSAGDLSTPIDGIAISGKTYKVYAKNKWLPAVTGYNVGDSNNGYAGVLGYEIYGLMIKDASYQVAVSEPDPTSCGTQNFISSGTGLRDVSRQGALGLREGCLFMAACVMGGLGNDKCILKAKTWAASQGYIRDSDTYVNAGGVNLAKYVSQHYGTTFHNNWSIKKGCGHYWLVNENGKEIFNSAGLGYSGC